MHGQTGSYVYHATLRAELTRTFGVQWTPVDKGIAEIAGIPKPLRRRRAWPLAGIVPGVVASEAG